MTNEPMREVSDEVIYPPEGYCIGVFGTRSDGMIGPFATEDEAREALAEARICVVGANFGPDQFQPAPPTPHIEQIKAYTQQLASRRGPS